MLQLLNCCFGFAQGFQVEIVLVFLFVLLAAQRQRFIEFFCSACAFCTFSLLWRRRFCSG